MKKDTVPQDYTLSLALFDAVPVVFFALAALLLWKMTGSALVLGGGVICFVSGMLKVLWKIIVVIQKKNVWFLFLQMRIGMPAGMILMLAGFIAACFTGDLSAFWSALLRPAPVIFVILSVLGMAAMIVCGSKLSSEDAGANWFEQGCNTLAQGSFFLAMLLIYLS